MVKVMSKKKLIDKNSCIRVFMWRDDEHKDNSRWSEFKLGMSSLETGAKSLAEANKIVKRGLESEYTHFVLSYPVSNQSVTKGNPHSHPCL